MMDAIKLSLILLSVIKSGYCHGVMVEPSPWFDFEGKSGEKREIKNQSANCILSGLSPVTRCAPGELDVPKCMWFTNYTFIPEEPTLPDSLRTYQDIVINGSKYDWTKVE